jgi:hypothetical protein
MKKILVILFAATTFFACNNTTSDKTTDSKSTNSGDLYFNYTIDGKEVHVDAADISSTYMANKTDTIYHLDAHAAKEGDYALLLTVPHDMTKPSATPSGSPNPKLNIMGGCATLLHYPQKDNSSLSYDNVYPENSPVIPDAIIITSSEKQGEDARIITGSFNFKTYDYKYIGSDTKITEHVIKGKFRVKHKLSDGIM